jgi:two-component system, OmpR family, response regulator MtrA
MNPKILVIDDDNALREMVGIVLSSAGFTPEYCPDGDQALEKFKQFEPDLVLLDVMLPGKDGIAVCREIRNIAGTPIIMLTAKTETTDVVLGLEAGADDYIVKPFEPSVLTARIKARLRPMTSLEEAVTIGPLDLGCRWTPGAKKRKPDFPHTARIQLAFDTCPKTETGIHTRNAA